MSELHNGDHFDDSQELQIPSSIAELIDCFRADVDSLSSPEFAPLAEWISQRDQNRRLFEDLCQLDRQIAVAYQDVKVPNDLSSRLKHQLVESSEKSLTFAEGRATQDKVEIAHVKKTKTSKTERKYSVKWHQVIGLVVAASLLIGWVGFAMLSDNRGSPSNEQLGLEALRWVKQIENRVDWNADFANAPIQRDVVHELIDAQEQEWLMLRNGKEVKRSDSTVAIRLRHRFGKSALLFVTREANDDIQKSVARSFSTTPFQTGGYSVGVCSRNGVTYYLVVEGSTEDYLGLLAHQRVG